MKQISYRFKIINIWAKRKYFNNFPLYLYVAVFILNLRNIYLENSISCKCRQSDLSPINFTLLQKLYYNVVLCKAKVKLPSVMKKCIESGYKDWAFPILSCFGFLSLLLWPHFSKRYPQCSAIYFSSLYPAFKIPLTFTLSHGYYFFFQHFCFCWLLLN